MRTLSAILIGGLALACAVASVGSSPVTLEGTRWTLGSLGADRAPIAETASEPWLEFGTVPGRVTGSGGCNRLTCSYERRGEKLELGLIASTRLACERGADVATALGAALGESESWAIVGGVLELHGADGRLLASFTPER